VSMSPLPQRSTLFPYTTLFRSALKYGKIDLGRMTWGIVLHTIAKVPTTQEASQTRSNFDADIEPLPLQFKKTGEGPLFETWSARSEEHTSELQSRVDLVCRLLL